MYMCKIILHRYSRDYVVEGTPYSGFDRHNGEIAAYHLDRYIIILYLDPCLMYSFSLTFIIMTSFQLLRQNFRLLQSSTSCGKKGQLRRRGGTYWGEETDGHIF